METAGPHDEVAQILPPLTVAYAQLEQGLAPLEDAVASVAGVEPLVA
ncbi:hypothetical protein AB0D45_00510 [Streptomyces sp. NPDC048352]